MTEYNPLRDLPGVAGYRPGDLLVLCGELFGRGYANGIVEEAKRRGMKVIGSTMGRRAADGSLRPLDRDELTEAEANLGGRIVNVPLEAGFDMEADQRGLSPVDRFKGIKSDDWEGMELDWEGIEESRKRGTARFKRHMDLFAHELEKMAPPGANVLFVHSMAGGVPRTRLFMTLFNRIFKGQGERRLSSERFWDSDPGRLCKLSFDEVTADSFACLIEGTESCRRRIEGEGGRVDYAAYGYHGCEVLMGGAYVWQSYTPYLPGWSKIRLEESAAKARQRGISATVFNSPEIQTNSSALFLGVEIPLYSLLAAMEREGGKACCEPLREECRSLLREGASVEALLEGAEGYLSSPILAPFREYSTWPHHNTPEQSDLMLNTSSALMEMNKNPREMVCALLSREVYAAVGKLMLDAVWESSVAAYWLGHDIIAKRLAEMK